MRGFFSFRYLETPARVPPVPMAQVKPSTRPSVCSQISGPVLPIVAVAVGGVVPLVRPERAHLLRQALGHVHVVVRVLVRHGRHFAQLGAAQPQHVLLLLALRLRDHDHRAVAARIADQRKADAGVARGALDDHAAGLEHAALLGIEDDVERRAVLHRAAGVEKLGLAKHVATGRLGRSAQADERAVLPIEPTKPSRTFMSDDAGTCRAAVALPFRR